MIAEAVDTAVTLARALAVWILIGAAVGTVAVLGTTAAAWKTGQLVRRAWVRARNRREGHCAPAEGTQRVPDGNLGTGNAPEAPQAPPRPSAYKEAA